MAYVDKHLLSMLGEVRSREPLREKDKVQCITLYTFIGYTGDCEGSKKLHNNTSIPVMISPSILCTLDNDWGLMSSMLLSCCVGKAVTFWHVLTSAAAGSSEFLTGHSQLMCARPISPVFSQAVNLPSHLCKQRSWEHAKFNDLYLDTHIFLADLPIAFLANVCPRPWPSGKSLGEPTIVPAASKILCHFSSITTTTITCGSSSATKKPTTFKLRSYWLWFIREKKRYISHKSLCMLL
jgi:hypothetical protein